MSGLGGTIKCYRIEEYDRYPGFVRLRHWGQMEYNWKHKRYELEHTVNANRSIYGVVDVDSLEDYYYHLTSSSVNLLKSISGQAVTQRTSERPNAFKETDFVRSVWYPQWPKKSPGLADIIAKIVQNGCHVVCVTCKHRSCRDDNLQRRFSFSLEEVILLQSATQNQQIHSFRSFL